MSKLRLVTLLFRLKLKIPGRGNDALLFRGRRVTVTVNGRQREELRTVRRALPLLVPPGSIARLAQRTRETDAQTENVAARAS